MSVELMLNVPKNPYDTNTFYGNGENIAELLENILQSYPELRPHILTEHNEIQYHFQVFHNQKHVRNLALQTPIKKGDEIFIFCAVKGG